MQIIAFCWWQKVAKSFFVSRNCLLFVFLFYLIEIISCEPAKASDTCKRKKRVLLMLKTKIYKIELVDDNSTDWTDKILPFVKYFNIFFRSFHFFLHTNNTHTPTHSYKTANSAQNEGKNYENISSLLWTVFGIKQQQTNEKKNTRKKMKNTYRRTYLFYECSLHFFLSSCFRFFFFILLSSLHKFHNSLLLSDKIWTKQKKKFFSFCLIRFTKIYKNSTTTTTVNNNKHCPRQFKEEKKAYTMYYIAVE